MGADFFDDFYDSNYYFCFCFSGFQYAFAVSQAMHQIWFIGQSFQGYNIYKDNGYATFL